MALVTESVDAAALGPADDLITRLASSASCWPEATAVEATDATLSYTQLERLSNQLAHRLLAGWPTGTGPEGERRVGVSLRRGATELVALLAVLKAGAAYVPLDPDHPRERLRLVMEDAAPEVLIVNPHGPLSQVAGPHELLVLEELEAGPGWPTTPPPLASPDALAYLMFTSGSTGRPKGVEVTRRALASFLGSMANTPGLRRDERLLAVTTTGFDIAGLELYLPLWVGATVVIADRETIRDPRRLRRRLERGDIHVMQATPATWRMLLDAGYRGDGQRLRMLCGGEALPLGLAERLLAAGEELWNMYGPTETTIWSSLERIEPGCDRITVGRPIDHTQLLVVDEALRPVPAGVEGELVIGGRGLARGYWRRPDLVAARFFHHADLGRLYRTGDLCRELPDGRIEWCGRLDHQVKIRGFRVELGEIEARLAEVPGVSHVLVVAHPGEGGDPRLTAYWVGEAGREALIEAARRWLPAAVVPAVYMRLDAFPLNANGKVDRGRLPPPAVADVPVLRPRFDTETRIAAIWREVLDSPDVPVDCDFFTVGGTSVLATRVLTRLQEQTGLEVPLRAFFEAPTIERLAIRIRHDLDREAPLVVRLRAGSDDRAPLFCLLGVHLYQDLALALRGDRSVIGIHVPIRYSAERSERPTLAEIAARYLEVIRAHQPRGPYHLLGLCFGGIVAYEVARQLEAAAERVAAVVVVDAVLPSAVHIDAALRVRDYAETVVQAWRAPQELRRRLQRQRERLTVAVRRRFMGSARRTGELATRSGELPIDGPELEAEVRRFCAHSSFVEARLWVVRATKAPSPKWRIVDGTQGWSQRAAQVSVRDVAADHLGVMREPHVRTLAQVVDGWPDAH